MTGYGARSAKIAGSEISVAVKSVNGRFLETRFHLPKEFFGLESQLKKKISQVLRRGTVDVFVHRRGNSVVNVRVNKDVAKKWSQAYKELGEVLHVKEPNALLMKHIASVPQVFEVRDHGEISKTEQAQFQKLFSEALMKCDLEREREGQSIQQHLKKLLKSLLTVIKKIEVLREKSQIDHELRLQERLKKSGIESAVEPARYAQELLLYLDKCDISEELERLKEHVQMCERYLHSKEEQGKKLDFYTQELLREVNTIGSKANSALITEQVVLAKGAIEALKEQVQNIE